MSASYLILDLFLKQQTAFWTKYPVSPLYGIFRATVGRLVVSKHAIPNNICLEDVLKARLKTTGVVEHSFSIAHSQRRFITWKIYDVGGARNQRHAWAPYFEDGNHKTLSCENHSLISLCSKCDHFPGTYICFRSGISRGQQVIARLYVTY